VIYYTVSDGDGDDIWIVNVDGTCERSLTSTSDPTDEYCPAWSPDGTRITYGVSSDSLRTSDVVFMRADGTDRRVLPRQGYFPQTMPLPGPRRHANSDLSVFPSLPFLQEPGSCRRPRRIGLSASGAGGRHPGIGPGPELATVGPLAPGFLTETNRPASRHRDAPAPRGSPESIQREEHHGSTRYSSGWLAVI
jgi:hypothetical protein